MTTVLIRWVKARIVPICLLVAGDIGVIGEKFAYVQLGVILAIFVRSFRVRAVDESNELLGIDYSVCSPFAIYF